ncbi:MAG TPA: hypothetical protein EYH43_00975 [Persephonella sp.]|nr:hypothetical protein [Hydrogenothermaceae bacterium]HIQ24540.1 hypothetical protein [Persephonella sp.]
MAGEFYISGISNTGFDYMGYLEKYKELKNIPIKLMEQQAEQIKLQKDALSAINNKLTALFPPALNLTLETTYETKSATVSNPDIASATVINNKALNGTYSLTVSSLAESSKWRIDLTATVDDVNTALQGSGTLTINYYLNGSEKSLNIDYTGKSLSDIANEINQSEDLEATIINVGDVNNPDYKLIVKSVNTGTQNTITGVSDTGTTFNTTSSTEIVAAQNASITLDGITITSQSNIFTGILTGVDITVKQTGSATLTVSDDFSNIKDNINAAIDGYNQLKETIRLATSQGQPLQGEATLNTIATSVLGVITNYLGKYGLINTLGDAESTKGLLELNEEAFNNFIQNNPDAKQILQDFGRALETVVTSYTDNLSLRDQRYQEQYINLQRRIEDLTKRIDTQIESMRLRFAKLEMYLSEMQATQLRIQNFAKLIIGNNNEQ